MLKFVKVSKSKSKKDEKINFKNQDDKNVLKIKLLKVFQEKCFKSGE